MADSDGFLDAIESSLGELACKIGDDAIVLTTALFSEEPKSADDPADGWVDEHICLLLGDEIMIVDDEDDDDPYALAGGFAIDDMRFRVIVGDAEDIDPSEIDCDFLIIMDDTPYHEKRAELITADALLGDKAIAKDAGCWVIRACCVGAQDSAIFAGGSCVVSPDGELCNDAVLFEENLTCIQIREGDDDSASADANWDISTIEFGYGDCDFGVYLDEAGLVDEAADWGAICTATRGYIEKNGFSDVVIGLSGGIDSSLVACVAADALGAEHVHGVLMPSMYSSQGSVDDALELAGNLGIDTVTISIEEPFAAFCNALAEPCGGSVEGLTRENLQARIRMVYVMALSNQYGWIMLNTGNKSEGIAGYSTLYGDTSGAYSPFGNIYKTRMYELAQWRNSVSKIDIVPITVLTKAPSAELRENQTDQDSLPPYEDLDGISSLYLEYGCSANEIVEEGYDKDLVNRVLRMISNNEHKRRQEPLGAWVDGISLTDDRAWPITNAYRDAVDEDLLASEQE